MSFDGKRNFKPRSSPGRPEGNLGTMWPKKLTAIVKPVPTFKSPLAAVWEGKKIVAITAIQR
ncbi:hypothetical protein [Ruegeria arenilitoris]|uniref:hypothetical protein n=1 Tax=Ruegeria arenilitoris TaxID=1173585 RepID=UPI00147D37D8|nr:hypothetical protein [Ruegeria arenilitoris]